MKKIVLTIRDDVCMANGKDVEATELIQKMKLWGNVTDFDKEVEALCKEYQDTIDRLIDQLSVVKDLTADEIVLLNSYRDCKEETAEKFLQRIGALEGQLDDIRAENQKRLAQIAEILSQTEMLTQG